MLLKSSGVSKKTYMFPGEDFQAKVLDPLIGRQLAIAHFINFIKKDIEFYRGAWYLSL